ncbi:MAG: gamma-glutamyl-gamma-aminobutyrate hydrolase family protein [Pyrinomonadaceae bacterium]
MPRSPVIGITMRLEIETGRFYLGRDYAEAVEAAGGIPVHLGLIPKASYIDAAIGAVDGVLLPGSDTDVDPAFFDEEPHPKLKKVVPEKDLTDRLVLTACEAARKPVFAICYGMQALNVFRGGSLVQDIESQIEEPLKHEQGNPPARASHSIAIDPHSLIGEANGRDDSARVNSHHHQAIGRLGDGLQAIAWAKDGVIEGIQDPRADRWALGVQWHPELSWATDRLSSELFRSFVEACR